VSDLSRTQRTSHTALCARCKSPMKEVMRIAPLRAEPGLIAFECPRCLFVTSEIWRAEDER
jgi:hypothetical protein